MSAYAGLFAQKEQQYGLPSGYLGKVAQIESRGNPFAQNPNSSAGGLFQFINSTARNYGLTDKFDPVASTDAAARLARDNQSYLTGKLGRDVTGGELYLAHQQGAGGAYKLLNSDGSAADIVGGDAARLNGGAGLSGSQLANKWTSAYDRSAGGEYAGGNNSVTEPAGSTGLADGITIKNGRYIDKDGNDLGLFVDLKKQAPTNGTGAQGSGAGNARVYKDEVARSIQKELTPATQAEANATAAVAKSTQSVADKTSSAITSSTNTSWTNFGQYFEKLIYIVLGLIVITAGLFMFKDTRPIVIQAGNAAKRGANKAVAAVT